MVGLAVRPSASASVSPNNRKESGRRVSTFVVDVRCSSEADGRCRPSRVIHTSCNCDVQAADSHRKLPPTLCVPEGHFRVGLHPPATPSVEATSSVGARPITAGRQHALFLIICMFIRLAQLFLRGPSLRVAGMSGGWVIAKQSRWKWALHLDPQRGRTRKHLGH